MVPYRPTTIGDAMAVEQPPSPEPISVRSVELLTDGTGADVEDIRLLDTDDAPTGSLVDTAWGFDPPAAAKRLPVTMEPTRPDRMKSYQVIFGIRVRTAAPGWFHSVRIRFQVGDHTYQHIAKFRLRLCTPKLTNCPLPPLPTYN